MQLFKWLSKNLYKPALVGALFLSLCMPVKAQNRYLESIADSNSLSVRGLTSEKQPNQLQPNQFYIGENENIFALSIKRKWCVTNEYGKITDFKFSKDGEQIAYAVIPSSGGEGGSFRITFVPAATSRKAEITSSKIYVPGYVNKIEWLDNQKIMATSSGGAGQVIFLLQAGGKPQQIFSAQHITDGPVLSPDGSIIALSYFSKEKPYQGEISLVDVESGKNYPLGMYGKDLHFLNNETLEFLTAEPDMEYWNDKPRQWFNVYYNIKSGEIEEKKKTTTPRNLNMHIESKKSPDGKMRIDVMGKFHSMWPWGDLVLGDLVNFRTAQLTYNRECAYVSWSPNSDMISYWRVYPIYSDRREEVQVMFSLWATPTKGPDIGKQMFVSPSMEGPFWLSQVNEKVKWNTMPMPSSLTSSLHAEWSPIRYRKIYEAFEEQEKPILKGIDRSKPYQQYLAYTSGSQLWIAELEYRDLNTEEKEKLGLSILENK